MGLGMEVLQQRHQHKDTKQRSLCYVSRSPISVSSLKGHEPSQASRKGIASPSIEDGDSPHWTFFTFKFGEAQKPWAAAAGTTHH
eukprot:4230019-Amphidinium_carterae.1